MDILDCSKTTKAIAFSIVLGTLTALPVQAQTSPETSGTTNSQTTTSDRDNNENDWGWIGLLGLIGLGGLLKKDNHGYRDDTNRRPAV